MKTLLALAAFALVTLPTILVPNQVVEPIVFAHMIPGRRFPPPIYYPGRVFNSGGGYTAEFYGLRDRLRRTNELIRLGDCGSACTTLLSLPNACVERYGTFTFHAARRYPNVVALEATAELFHHVPKNVRRILSLEVLLSGKDQVRSGSQLIAAGMRPCPY